MVDTAIGLLPHQWEAWTRPEPFRALVTGLGGGKTYTGSRWLINEAIAWPRSLHLATANSHAQARDVVIPALRKAAEEFGVPHVFKKVESKIFLELGDAVAEIRIRSTQKDHVDDLRGAEYGRWWGDEARDCSRYAFEVIRNRLRCQHVDRPQYLLTTTPNGFDWLYEEHVTRADDRKALIQATSRDNPYLSEDYTEGTLGDLDSETIRQERDGEFVSLGAGAVYRSFSRLVHAKQKLAYDPRKPLVLCADFNVGFYGWVLAQVHSETIETRPGHHEARETVHVIAEHTPRNCTVIQAVQGLVPQWGEHRAGWLVYPDAAGGQRNRQTGKTDTEVLIGSMRDLGLHDVRDRSARSNPAVKDRVAAVNAMLLNAKGERRLFVDPECRELIRDMEQLVWREGGADIDKRDANRSHCSDALGYFIHAEHAPSTFRPQPGYGMRSHA